ncbi:hypothetical protein EAI_01478 [Harpegnathos saltator]|uniref:Uncharacterized protein n=1 Tax=Harpegnathos saltator TaxID=610380 RepID=E2BX63_HARSA|nr:hypothetical protein EAI_01478 [Harpegnathos saltator]
MEDKVTSIVLHAMNTWASQGGGGYQLLIRNAQRRDTLIQKDMSKDKKKKKKKGKKTSANGKPREIEASRSNGGRKPARVVNITTSNSGGSSVAEVGRTTPSLIPTPKKRGRPATTFKGVRIRERKEKEAKERKEKELLRLEREAWDLFDRGMYRSMDDTRPAKEVYRDPASAELLSGARASELASKVGCVLGG